MNKIFKILYFLIGLSFFLIPSQAKAVSIVNPNQTYTYSIMTSDIQKLAQAYPNLISYKSIGKTTFGRDIWAVKLGTGDVNVFINASHHAREWMGTNISMYMIDRYADAYVSGNSIGGYNARDLLSKTSIWFVPMVNPDGVTLQQFGPSAFPSYVQNSLLYQNDWSKNFSRWKANGQGIDLNRQYPADWIHIQDAFPHPHFDNYKGTAPETAPETVALMNFTYQIDPEIAVAYHTAGHILYWNFHTLPQNYNRDKRLADSISQMTGYSEVPVSPNPSGGGYTDWFIQEFGHPGFTPEIGTGYYDTNLPIWMFSDEWNRNYKMGFFIADEGYKLSLSEPKTVPYVASFPITSTSTLYSYPNPTAASYGQISPQTVYAFEKRGNYYHISTYLGPKWIYFSGQIPVVNPTPLNKKITLTDFSYLYDSPTSLSSVGALDPQTVYAVASWNGNVQISTSLGLKWVKNAKYLDGEPQTYNYKVLLPRFVYLYDSPLSNKPVGALAPQTVYSVKELGGYLQVVTSIGPKWIIPDNYLFDDPASVQKTITLKEFTRLYSSPTSTTSTAALAPQKVIAYREWSGYYQIGTSLGLMWIKPGNFTVSN